MANILAFVVSVHHFPIPMLPSMQEPLPSSCILKTHEQTYFRPEVSWKLCARELNHLSGLIGGNVFSDKNWFLLCL